MRQVTSQLTQGLRSCWNHTILGKAMGYLHTTTTTTYVYKFVCMYHSVLLLDWKFSATRETRYDKCMNKQTRWVQSLMCSKSCHFEIGSCRGEMVIAVFFLFFLILQFYSLVMLQYQASPTHCSWGMIWYAGEGICGWMRPGELRHLWLTLSQKPYAQLAGL